MAEHVRNQRGEGDKLRALIVDAATRMVDEGVPVASLSLRSIARAAGISAPSIYPHFASLDVLVTALIDASFLELRRLIEASATADPADTLRAACVAYFQFGRAHVERYRAMFSPDGYGPESGQALAYLETLLAECVSAGASASTDVHGDAFILWAAMHGMTTIPRPARVADQRLGASDRSALFAELVTRLARLTP